MNETQVQQEHREKESSDLGIWVFVLGDMLIFSIIFGSYAFDRSLQHELYWQSQQLLNDSYALLNTLLLLTGSLFVVLALHIARQGGGSLWVSRLVGLTIATGFLFLANKIVEYTEKVGAGYTLLTNEFFTYYYMITGLHMLHVIVGISVLFYVLSRLKQSPKNLTVLQNGGVIWHMVDLLWIVLFPLIYLVK